MSMSTMEEGDQELDYEIATDIESAKIRKLENELASVSSSEDKYLLVWLGAGVLAIGLFILFPNIITTVKFFIVIPMSVLGGVGSTIYRNLSRKRKVLIKHGLKCGNCGFIPSTLNASGVIGSKKCLKCYSKLDI